MEEKPVTSRELQTNLELLQSQMSDNFAIQYTSTESLERKVEKLIQQSEEFQSLLQGILSLTNGIVRIIDDLADHRIR